MYIASEVSRPPAVEKVFVSKDGGYTVRYPATWNLLRHSIDNKTNHENLDILSFPNSKRAEAVTIIHGGAEIILRKRAAAVPPLREDEVLSSKTVPLNGPCSSAKVVETRWEVGPKTYERDVSVSCKTSRTQYELNVRMWDDDPKRGQYEAVGRKVLESLQEK